MSSFRPPTIHHLYRAIDCGNNGPSKYNLAWLEVHNGIVSQKLRKHVQTHDSLKPAQQGQLMPLKTQKGAVQLFGVFFQCVHLARSQLPRRQKLTVRRDTMGGSISQLALHHFV